MRNIPPPSYDNLRFVGLQFELERRVLKFLRRGARPERALSRFRGPLTPAVVQGAISELTQARILIPGLSDELRLLFRAYQILYRQRTRPDGSKKDGVVRSDINLDSIRSSSSEELYSAGSIKFKLHVLLSGCAVSYDGIRRKFAGAVRPGYLRDLLMRWSMPSHIVKTGWMLRRLDDRRFYLVEFKKLLDGGPDDE